MAVVGLLVPLLLVLAVGLLVVPLFGYQLEANLVSDESRPPDRVSPGQVFEALLTVKSGSPVVACRLKEFEVFIFTLNSTCVMLVGIEPRVLLDSEVLAPGDFVVGGGPFDNQVMVSYIGPNMMFPRGDSFSVRVKLQATRAM
ncbi:MAG TPA: hypothetical protein VJH03_12830 [Blastocatellia bacterium]|nr:hypothetical protein [Blastocatellia bacterium]